MKNIIILFMCIGVFLSFISADLGVQNPTLPKITKPSTTGGGNTYINSTSSNITNYYYNNTYNNNTYNVTYNVTNNISMDYTNIFMKNQSNNVAVGYQQNFLDNVSMINGGFNVQNGLCFDGTQFELAFGTPKLCGNGFREVSPSGNVLSFINGNATGVLNSLFSTTFSQDVYTNLMIFEQNATPIDGTVSKDVTTGIIIVQNDGSQRKGVLQLTDSGIQLGTTTDDIYYPSAGGDFVVYGDTEGNDVFSIDSGKNYRVKIGDDVLPYKTNLDVKNGNGSFSDCIILGGQAICNWGELNSYLPAGGNSSFNQSLTDTLYYPRNSNPNGYYNLSSFNINNYYLNSNPSNYWNSSSNGFNKTYADTLYILKGTNLNPFDQNLNTTTINVKFASLYLNGSSNLGGGQTAGLRVDKDAIFYGRLGIGGSPQESSLGLSILETMNITTNNLGQHVGNYVSLLVNDTTGYTEYFANQYGASLYSNTTGARAIAFDSGVNCWTNGTTCIGVRSSVNVGDGIPKNVSLIGMSISALGSSTPYGNKGIDVDGGVEIHTAGAMTYRFIGKSGYPVFAGSMGIKDSLEVGNWLFAEKGFFQNEVNSPSPPLTAQANYDEGGNEMNMNVSVVKDRLNKTVWAVDNKGNEWMNGTATAKAYHNELISVYTLIGMTGTTGCSRMSNLISGVTFTCQSCVDTGGTTQTCGTTLVTLNANCLCKED